MEVREQPHKTFSIGALQEQNPKGEKCKWATREKNNSVLCEKLDQWLSPKYCVFCRFNKPKTETATNSYCNYLATPTTLTNERNAVARS